MSLELERGYRQTEVRGTEPNSNAKLLLMHVTPYRYFPNDFSEPFGIRQLAGTLVARRVPVAIDLGVLRSAEGIEPAKDAIRSGGYTHVGLGLRIGSLEDGHELIDYIAGLNEEKRKKRESAIKVLIGGDLPTSSNPDDMTALVRRFPDVTVVRSWGDFPLFALMQNDTGTGNHPLEQIPSLIYNINGQVRVNKLKANENFQAGTPVEGLTTLQHVANVAGSENCSHPYCTFCSRPPLPAGVKEVWKTKPIDQIVQQIATHNRQGRTNVTFTDEEALGTTAGHAIEHGGKLAQAVSRAKVDGTIDPRTRFAFSTRSDSIVALADAGRVGVLEDLAKAGLTRIFLGVETGVPHDFIRWDGLTIPSQARRYGKGIKAGEHVRAAKLLGDVGIGMEIGFIPFDPLMDLGEIRANAHFLLDNGLAKHSSLIFNKLRMQSGAKYELLMENLLNRLVIRGELPKKPELLGAFNPSTLQRDYSFLHPVVGGIVDSLYGIQEETRDSIYAVKSYERSHFITGEPTEGRGAETLTSLRELDLQLMLAYVDWTEQRLDQLGIPRAEYDKLRPLLGTDPRLKETVQTHRERRDSTWKTFLNGDMPDHLRTAILQGMKKDSVKR